MIQHEKVQPFLFKEINKSNQNVAQLNNVPNPYFDIKSCDEPISHRDDIVFISSRFRSGSTVLWNAFRQLDNCTAFYEPFNERKWFNKSDRGALVDGTHVGVNDYWTEFDKLDCLNDLYNEDWIREGLLMTDSSWDPKMKLFIEKIISHAQGSPVLQFNRIDFRLPWIKKNFPNAKILHLYRHPRDQWFSFLTDKNLMNKDDVEQSYEDSFYLDVWCKDLTKYFPFLAASETPHPYARFYLLWKLSYLYGKVYSNHSICYEDLCANPQSELKSIFNELGWDNVDTTQSANVIEPPKLDKWKSYADDAWFSQHEIICESVLNEFFRQKA